MKSIIQKGILVAGLSITSFLTLAQNAQDSVEVIFNETWDEQSFIPKGWTRIPENANWVISTDDGNPQPSVGFGNLPMLQDYSMILMTPEFSIRPGPCFKTWLSFDYKLVTIHNTGNEKVYIDLYQELAWQVTAELTNEKPVDWTRMNILLTEGNAAPIRIRFRAEGANAADIQHWYFDNIKIYTTCNPPAGLAVTGVTDRDVALSWNPPECSGDTTSRWIYWDDRVPADGIGSCPACCIELAARWDTSQVKSFSGMAVTKIAFAPCGAGNANFRARVYKGDKANLMLYDQPVPNPVPDVWNIVELNTPVPIDTTQELWVGLNAELIDGYPLGCDSGPAISGYGDMIYSDGNWAAMSVAYGLDYNWNIEAYIEPVKGKYTPLPTLPQYPCELSEPLSIDSVSHDKTNVPVIFPSYPVTSSILGYNLWRSVSEDTLFQKVNANPIPDHEYTDYTPGYNRYSYKITALFNTGDSTEVESWFSNTVSVNVIAGMALINNNNLSFRPNPASDYLEISSKLPLEEVALRSLAGQTVLVVKNPDDRFIRIDVSGMKPGLYVAKIVIDGETVYQKIAIAR
jgi:hypothetical protein